MRLGTWFGRAGALAGAIAATAVASGAQAADHRDGAVVQRIEGGGADITDVFAWMNGDRAVLAMNVHRDAGAGALFSDAVQYVFHVRRHVQFPLAASSSLDVICEFDEAQMIQCWVGDEAYVTGDAGVDAGITNAAEDIRIFAGPRQDPFFFYQTGFEEARDELVTRMPNILEYSMNPSGCPELATVGGLVQDMLQADSQADNDFGDENVLAIVIELDAGYVAEPATPVFSVWAATHLKRD